MGFDDDVFHVPEIQWLFEMQAIVSPCMNRRAFVAVGTRNILIGIPCQNRDIFCNRYEGGTGNPSDEPPIVFTAVKNGMTPVYSAILTYSRAVN